MTNDPRDEPEGPSQVSVSLEDGLAAGFGPPLSLDDEPAPSILERIARSTGVRPGISLREELSQEPSRLLRPLGPGRPNVPTTTGKYQLQGEIARGGVGVVLRGHDIDLGRDVAMKVMHEKYLGNPDLLQRFVEEAQIGGQLQHPGIVPVYDLGLTDGRPYFTMKLIKGRTLAAVLAERVSAAEDRRVLLNAFEQVCQTMAYAHARGVIHRDLKPANVMVGSFGEVQVVDWGMGKVLGTGGTAEEERAQKKSEVSVIETVRSQSGSGSTHSRVGSVMGTPAYMPPEQANGDVENMDEHSDVFSLGAILCEILTGAPPYAGEAHEVLAMATAAQLEPCMKRLGQADIDDELRGLCADCLSPTRAARPRNAEIVAERLAGYLAAVEERARGAQIEAAEERVRAVAARRSQRLTLGLAASVLLTMVLVGGGYWWVEQAAQARRTEISGQLARALNEANTRFGEARAAGFAHPARWDHALSAAERAVELAGNDEVITEQALAARRLLETITAKRVAAAREVMRLARDRAMHERLVRLRFPMDESADDSNWALRHAFQLNHGYEHAFTDYLGIAHIRDKGVDETLAILSRSERRIEFAAALDHWALIRDAEGPPDNPTFTEVTAHVRQVATRLDSNDSWRNGLRALLPEVKSKRADLERLAGNADVVTLPAVSLVLLSDALWFSGAQHPAVEVLRRGRELHPSDFGVCFRLAILLGRLDEPQWEEAVHALSIAHALRPEMREVLHRQGLALNKLGRIGEALRLFQDLARGEPRRAHWLFHVGENQRLVGRLDDATQTFQRILELDPEYDLHGSLGLALFQQGKYATAIVSFRHALEVTPKKASLHNNLAIALLRQGKLEEALPSLSRAHELFTARHDPFGEKWAAYTAQYIEEAKAAIARRPALEEILRGGREPISGEEWADAAELAHGRHEYALAARTYRAAFDAHPSLLAEYYERFTAACAAAQCGTGHGQDAGELDAGERAAWRQQAVVWLRAELEAQAALAAGAGVDVRERLQQWQQDSDLAGIREEASIATLPESERAQCRALWAAVRAKLEEIMARGAKR